MPFLRYIIRAEFTGGHGGQVPPGPPAQGAPLKSKNNAKIWEKTGNKEEKKWKKKELITGQVN